MTPPPLRVYSTLLTSADALAWETLPRDGRKRDFFLLIALAIVAGLALGLVPEDWTAGWRFYGVGLSFCVLGYCLWIAITTFDAYLRARRRVPGPMEVRVAQWLDRFEVTENGRTRFVALESIMAVTVTATHLFIFDGKDLIILPVSAFDSDADMRATAAALELQLRDPD